MRALARIETILEILNLDHLKGIKTLPIRDNLGYMDANCYGHGQNAITVKYIKEQPQVWVGIVRGNCPTQLRLAVHQRGLI